MKYIVMLCLIAAGATPVHAQGPLDRVQSLMATGRFTEARNTLGEWETTSGSPQSSATPAERARALFLRGVLSTDAKEAEEAFVGVVLSYPFSPSAPPALLRLGQSLVTGGDYRRAMAYLGRLRSDYPGVPERETGLVWLARAQFAAGTATAACATAREAITSTTNQNVRTLATLERDRACTSQPVSAASASARPANNDSATTPAVAAPTQSFAVQTAAFREMKSAETVAAQLRAKGFEARIVLIDGSPLFRVRFGSFASTAEAAVAGQRVRDAGFAVMIVSDALKEKKP